MATYTHNTCPVCASPGFAIIGAVNEPSPPVHIPDGSAIVKCRACKLIYTNPMPHWSDDDYAKLYDDAYFAHLKTDDKQRWMDVRENVLPRRRFARAKRHMRADDKTMLEIGANRALEIGANRALEIGANHALEIGAGEFAFMSKHLLSLGWDVTAQEPGKPYADKLRAIPGLKVETVSVADLPPGQYAFIFADSVLEHTPNPVDYYLKIADLLAPGGVFYTVSPHEYSVHNYLANRAAKRRGQTPHYIAPYAEPYHLVGFTRKSLDILAQKSGLRLASYKKIDDYMAFHTLGSGKRAIVKWPLAGVYAAAQLLGKGANGEAVFVKG